MMSNHYGTVRKYNVGPEVNKLRTGVEITIPVSTAPKPVKRTKKTVQDPEEAEQIDLSGDAPEAAPEAPAQARLRAELHRTLNALVSDVCRFVMYRNFSG